MATTHKTNLMYSFRPKPAKVVGNLQKRDYKMTVKSYFESLSPFVQSHARREKFSPVVADATGNGWDVRVDDLPDAEAETNDGAFGRGITYVRTADGVPVFRH